MRSFKVSSCLSLIFFITCLVCTVSAQWRTQNYTDATTDCGFPRITRDNINRTSFNHWFEEQYNTFRDPDKWNKNDSLLRDYLLPRWSTVDPVSAASTCNVVQQCSLVRTCTEMKKAYPDSTDEDLGNAYTALVQIQNFNNFFNKLHESLQSVPGEVGNLLTHMSSAFSYGDQVKSFVKAKINHQERTMATSFAIGGSAFSIAASCMGMPFVTGKTMTGAFPLANWIQEKGPAFLKAASIEEAKVIVAYISPSMFAARSAWGGSLETYGAWKLLDRALKPTEGASDLLSIKELGPLLNHHFDALAGVIEQLASLLINGDDISGVTSLINVLATGTFLKPPDQARERSLRVMFRQYLVAQLLDTIWSGENVYIHMRNAPEGCENEGEGPLKNKICLQEFPKKSFRLYAFPRWQEYGPHKKSRVASPAMPPGWDLLQGDGYEGITAEMIVRSSVLSFGRRGKNVPLEYTRGPKDFFTRPEDILDWSPAREGIFNVAVCHDPSGHFTSSLDTFVGRQLPCYCLSPAAENDNDKSDIAEQTAGFLDVSGLSRSQDLYQGCSGHGESRQSCSGNGGDLWQFYNRTQTASLKKVFTHAFTMCGTQIGDKTAVGTPQCERKGKCVHD